MAEEKSLYRKQIEGGFVTLGSLRSKIEELQKRHKLLKSEGEEGDKEDADKIDDNIDVMDDERGFADSDPNGEASSEEEKDIMEDLEAQLEMLQEQEELIEAQQALNEIFDQAFKEGKLQEDDGKGGSGFRCESEQEATNLAVSIKAQYEALGLKCDIVRDKESITVVVHLPEKYKGKNPLSMSAEELKEAGKEYKLEEGKEVPTKSPKPTLGKWTGMVNEKKALSHQQQQEGSQLVH